MSWRGTEGGIAAAKQKHYVVMTPGSHCYFDYYQGHPKNEPLAIGGYLPVEKVYSFNPIPKELSTDEAQYILGAQANVWTEYIEKPQNVEYMIFPRMLALSEVLWGTSNSEKYTDFQNRMIQQFAVLDQKGIQYSKAIFEVTTKVSPSPKSDGVLFELHSANDSKKIKYTLDGTAPTISSNAYNTPIQITKNQTVKAAYFDKDKQQSAVMEQAFYVNKATGKKITLANPPHENYSNGGPFTLVDGMYGNRSRFGREWLGFSGKDLIATIDLGTSETISKISVSVLENQGSWIYYPNGIELLISNDGQNFQNLQKITLSEIRGVKGNVIVNFKSQNVQYIKIVAANKGKISEGNPGAGADAWLFVDEISIE